MVAEGDAGKDKGLMMRLLSPFTVLLTLALTAAPIAQSQTQAVSALPVISASLSRDNLVVRMTRGVMGHTPDTRVRELRVRAVDSAGTVIEERTVVVGKRLTYASIPLSAAMRSASRIVVTGE